MLTPTTDELHDVPQLASIAARLVGEELPEQEVHELLLRTAPERLSAEGFAAFVDTVRYMLADEYRSLSSLQNSAFDCCGTGGSGLQHFNTSTAVSFVVGAAGFSVVKFGNRAASGACGSFDFLEQLGFSTTVTANQCMQLLDACNQAFLFAPQCYPSLARIAPARKSLRQRTIFNYIGPLLNPSRPARRLLGVSDARMQQHIAQYLASSGITQKAMIVRSEQNLDEVDPEAINYIIQVEGGQKCSLPPELARICFDNRQMQPAEHAQEPLSAQRNVVIFQSVIEGKERGSRYAKLLQANAGAALYVAGKTQSLSQGCQLAGELVAEGAVKAQFEKVRAAYARLVN